MKADKYRFDGSSKCRLSKLPTNSKQDNVVKEEILARFEENLARLDELQNCHYADKREGLIIVLQALDAAGKDSLIRHVASGMNPQGVKVYCCKAPSAEELSHDYLWRINKSLPARGEVMFYNRSWYEDIIATKEMHLKDSYQMKPRVIGQSEDEFIAQRIRQVANYEQYLYENSYRVIKVFLHVSKDVQRERFLERIDREDKNWKFSRSDLGTRAQFDDYMETIGDVITRTATKESPWYAIPADQKWYTRYLLSEILVDVFEQMQAQYPVMPAEERGYLAECKAALLAEEGTSDELIRLENATEISGDGKVDMDLYDDGTRNGSSDGKVSHKAAAKALEDGKGVDKAQTGKADVKGKIRAAADVTAVTGSGSDAGQAADGRKEKKKKDGAAKKGKKDKKDRKDSDKKDKKNKKNKHKAGEYEKITDL